MALSVLAAIIAVSPIAYAIVDAIGGGSATRSAFASVPAGLYAVSIRSDEGADVVVATAAGEAADVIELAHVAHLPGFTSSGSVSPDGTALAMVVADSGSLAQPRASLVVMDLVSGAVTRLAESVDLLQTPLWSTDSRSVVVTRSLGDGPALDVVFALVPRDGGEERQLHVTRRALGAYAVAFDGEGGLLSVAVDARGSVLQRDGADALVLSAHVTRDWRLSPDGSAVAFIEADTSAGLRYHQRVVALDGSAAAQTAARGGQQLGIAWKAGASTPASAEDPAGGSSRAAAQRTAGGFEVPLAYSPDGAVLAVQAWTGDSFATPGEMALTLVAGDDRIVLEHSVRFFGWARR